jgi:hypothetical protein
MTTLGSALRKRLENTIREAREVADEAAADAVARLAVAAPDAPAYLSDQQKALRRRLRAYARALGDRRDVGSRAMTTAQLAEAVAYEHWHRMLFGRFLVERDLLIHPKHGVPISGGDLKELAEEEGFADEWEWVERLSAPRLPAVFRPDDPALELKLDPHFQLRLRRLVTELPEEVFTADDSLGWTYQFWRAAEKKLIDQAVKEGRIKIGAAELPAVTQLFTEPYMVKFLLHNTLGGWWAGKLLAANSDLARSAPDEDALREACVLPGVQWEYLRFVREEGGEDWRPAAGTFPGWPQSAAEITYCDPCCGSGHFLVEAFAILAALRQAEEGLSAEEAARAVLRDNLHGLEIDGRCVQIAAFNVALAAWQLAAGPVDLPVPHIAWVGAPPPPPKSEFVALANDDAELQRGLAALHDLFRQAPLLGSLIELTGGDLVDPARIARIEQSITGLVEKIHGAEPDQTEGALTARGMADAASHLARMFVLQATNVPFLGSAKQATEFRKFIALHYPEGQQDLYAAFVLRLLRGCAPGGSVAVVTPQGWQFLASYERFRFELLSKWAVNQIADLGPAAFQDMNFWAARTALAVITNSRPDLNTEMTTIDASRDKTPESKTNQLVGEPIGVIRNTDQITNPKSTISTALVDRGDQLVSYAFIAEGLSSGDNPRFRYRFWEIDAGSGDFELMQGSPTGLDLISGCHWALRWEGGSGAIAQDPGARVQGQRAWGKAGFLISAMRGLAASLQTGAIHEKTTAAVVPTDVKYSAPIWAFITSPEYAGAIRRIYKKTAVATGSMLAVSFNLAHWQKVAAEKYPNGLPEAYSDDPTQWLFHGHPRYAEPGTELHVALARLAGYRWPAESDAEMRLSFEARQHIAEVAALPEPDADGLLPLVAALGKRPLADRLRAYSAVVWGDFWTPDSEAALIASACERANDKPPKEVSFDSWLHGHAARQHARLFHDRPFLWWITDGRPDGFTVVAHYHRLGRANLERLAYSMLNDWIARLGDDPRSEAARILQQQLALVLEGEVPYDLFVRWKPLARQPLGWDRDLDDGVRLNIRPFVEAKVLVYVPNVKYSPPDRGTDVPTAPWYDLFGGKRRNDHHTSLAEKRAARAQAA